MELYLFCKTKIIECRESREFRPHRLLGHSIASSITEAPLIQNKIAPLIQNKIARITLIRSQSIYKSQVKKIELGKTVGKTLDKVKL